MESQHKDEFYIIGINVRTTNEDQQAARDIPKLWERFMSENAMAAIPNKLEESIYCLYTDYESDHTKPYTTVLGCKVSDLNQIPDGMVGKKIENGNYGEIKLKGNLLTGLVYNAWLDIWNANYDRKFTSDYEVYGPKSSDITNAEVDIFLALN